MKKRTIALLYLLLAALALLSFASCGNTPQTVDTKPAMQENSTAASTDPAFDPEIPDVKFSCDFIVASTFATDTKYTSNLVVAEDMDGDLIRDAIFRRTSKIKDQLDVNIVVEDVKYTQINTTFQAGDRPYDLGSATLSDIMKCVNAGAAVNLKDIGTAHLEKPWWDQNANEKFRIGDNLYYTFSDFFITGIDNSRAVYFNKDMATDLKLENFYDLVKNNNWTVAKMAELAVPAKIDNGDAVIGLDDTIGVTARSVTLYEAFLSGCNAELVKQGPEGIPYFCPFEEKAFFEDVYSTLLNLFGKPDVYYACSAANARKQFEEGRGLFTVDTLCLASLMRQNSTVNFGIMPVPKFNTDQEKYMHVSPNPHAFFIIPGDSETLERDGAILDAASYYSSSYYSHDALMPCYFQLALVSKSATDNESAGNLQIVHDNISYVIKIVGTEFSGKVYDQFAANNPEISSFLKNNEDSEKLKLRRVLEGLGIGQ